MKFIRVLLICMAVLCSVHLSWAADDWEIWPDNKIKVKLNDKVSLDFIEEFRINDNMSTFHQYVLYVGSYIKLNKYIDTAVWYKFVESKKYHHWEDSHRCDVDGILKYNLEGFKLSNRSRFEYNFTENSWIYRDRVKVAKEFEIFKRKYTPYFFNEFFIDINPDAGYHENRANVGVSTPFFCNTKLTLYYMSRAKKKENWNNANILGASVGLVF